MQLIQRHEIRKKDGYEQSIADTPGPNTLIVPIEVIRRDTYRVVAIASDRCGVYTSGNEQYGADIDTLSNNEVIIVFNLKKKDSYVTLQACKDCKKCFLLKSRSAGPFVLLLLI